jgi:hypothetical protein
VDLTDRPFVEEVPRLLRERGLSIRALAREVGVTDGHLSRVMRRVNYKTAGPELARRPVVESRHAASPERSRPDRLRRSVTPE